MTIENAQHQYESPAKTVDDVSSPKLPTPPRAGRRLAHFSTTAAGAAARGRAAAARLHAAGLEHAAAVRAYDQEDMDIA